MRLAVSVSTLALTAALAAPAHAQGGSFRNASEASKQVVTAVGAIGESGLKASTGIVAIPLGGVAVASGVVGNVAGASGFTDVETAFTGASEEEKAEAKKVVDFSGSPLTVSNDIIVDRPKAPVAQPAPHVPFAAEQK